MEGERGRQPGAARVLRVRQNLPTTIADPRRERLGNRSLINGGGRCATRAANGWPATSSHSRGASLSCSVTP